MIQSNTCCYTFLRLRESCEVLLFTYSEEYGRKAEELLWRKVFYDLIQKLKYFRKVNWLSFPLQHLQNKN